jgi:lysophospholipase L1-like esterase
VKSVVKKMVLFLLLLTLTITGIFATSVNAFASSKCTKTIYMVGDSTMCNYEEDRAPRTGWGQVFGEYFNKNIVVENNAVSGRSSKSYWDEGLLDEFKDEMEPGDYLFIQFGHNDSKSSDPARYTDPYTTYQEYLTMYINEARERKVHPILLTPINRRKFDDDGNLILTHKEYPQAMIDLGEELNVPVIDLTEKTIALYEEYGVEGTKDLFLWLDPGESENYPNGKEDNTHLQTLGAHEISKLVVEGIKEERFSLAKYLKKIKF